MSRLHRLFSQWFFAFFISMAPSTVPDWRADPGMRTVAVLPIGEPVTPLHRDRL